MTLTREDRINRTEAWKQHCQRFAHLAGVNADIWKELKLQAEELATQRKAIVATGKKAIRDPFVGYIAV